jgi:hypothetical protein
VSTPDDDLRGRQLVLLLLFFAVVGGGLYILRWPNFLSGNPIACAAIAGAACYPARFLVERFEWWKVNSDGLRCVRLLRNAGLVPGQRSA